MHPYFGGIYGSGDHVINHFIGSLEAKAWIFYRKLMSYNNAETAL